MIAIAAAAAGIAFVDGRPSCRPPLNRARNSAHTPPLPASTPRPTPGPRGPHHRAAPRPQTAKPAPAGPFAPTGTRWPLSPGTTAAARPRNGSHEARAKPSAPPPAPRPPPRLGLSASSSRAGTPGRGRAPAAHRRHGRRPPSPARGAPPRPSPSFVPVLRPNPPVCYEPEQNRPIMGEKWNMDQLDGTPHHNPNPPDRAKNLLL